MTTPAPTHNFTTAGALAEDIANRCEDPYQESDGSWRARCPSHQGESNTSLHITSGAGAVLLYCHAGCDTSAVMAALTLPMNYLFLTPKRSGRRPLARLVATYSYTDAAGTVLYETVRLDPKGFYQRQPDPAKPGKWLKSITKPPVTRVLYNLPEVVDAVAHGRRVAIVEGEKDVVNLAALGICGTCNVGGAGKWDAGYTATLAGAHAVILPDNDAPGHAHGLLVAQALHGQAASVRLLHLPGLAEKGDVSDWLAAGGTKEQLTALVEQTQLWTPPVAAEGIEDPLTTAGDTEDTDELAALARQDDDTRLPIVRYRVSPHGLVWDKPTKDGPSPVLLSNFTATIRAEITEDDGVETRLRFALEAQLHGKTYPVDIPAVQFAGMNWVTACLGATAIVMPGMTLKDHTRAAIQLLSPQVERRHIYTHLGWRNIDGSWCYLHAHGAIGPGGPKPDVEVEARHTLAAYILPPLTTRAAECAALRASLRVLDTAADQVTVPLYAAIWRAVLGHSDVSLHLVGPTGAGKSELAALIQQHYGAGMTARHLPAAWTSTGNALEGLAFEAKDVVLVVDDFCPSGAQTDIARFHKDADRLFRAQGNHSARQRMRTDGTLRPVKPPRGLIVSTGEDTPQGQSLRARVLILDVPKGCVDWSKLTTCQQDAADGTYATTLAGFVQWLAPHYEAVSQGLRTELTTLRQAALTTGHRRTPELIGNLALGMQYLLAYGHAIGALTFEECSALWQRSWTALGNAGDVQGEHQASEEPVRRFSALLTGALAAGLAHVADAHTLGQPSTHPQQWGWRGYESGTGEHVEMSWKSQGSCVGWLANDRLFLEPEAAFSVVQKLAESQKAPLPITQQTLWKRIHEQGLLIRNPSENKNQVRRSIGSDRRYVVDISVYLLLENGTSGTSGTKCPYPQQNQHEILSPFPVWYIPKTGQPANLKTGQRTNASPSGQDVQVSMMARPAFSPSAVPFSFEETGQQGDVQPKQNQGKISEISAFVPFVPFVPFSERDIPLEVQTALNGPNGTTAPNTSPLTVGAAAYLLSTDGAIQNAVPYTIQRIDIGPDGKRYALFAECAGGWLLAQCERAALWCSACENTQPIKASGTFLWCSVCGTKIGTTPLPATPAADEEGVVI